ncbi:hypothetical protein LCGC14_1711350 [marine sediment metagenome]|uniref:Uncharacterized protein n=1 Tax=marine sediment metagenome TaxID=412755 RepID=A0A0F9I2M1_9ZZZZ
MRLGATMTDIPLDIPPASLGTRGQAAGQRDGCRCPQGIVRCAHLGDRVVWLVDSKIPTGHRPANLIIWEVMYTRWGVAGPGTLGQCSCMAGHRTMISGRTYHHINSLADAEAEFERRCVLLRSEA